MKNKSLRWRCKHGGRTQTVVAFEEIADVQIMLEQLRLIFGLNDLVHEYRNRKIPAVEGQIAHGTTGSPRINDIHDLPLLEQVSWF